MRDKEQRKNRLKKKKEKTSFRNMSFAHMKGRKGGPHKDKRKRQKYQEDYSDYLNEEE